jgi:hypothetical protein
VVARFTAPAPPRLERVTGLKLRKRTMTWRHQPGVRYEVAVITRDGAVTSRSVTRARLRLPRGRLRVMIVPVDAQGRVGPRMTARLRVKR